MRSRLLVSLLAVLTAAAVAAPTYGAARLSIAKAEAVTEAIAEALEEDPPEGLEAAEAGKCERNSRSRVTCDLLLEVSYEGQEADCVLPLTYRSRSRGRVSVAVGDLACKGIGNEDEEELEDTFSEDDDL